MAKEILEKKLNQLQVLLNELGELFKHPFIDFKKEVFMIRAAERNFQLIVDVASDMNGQILFERGNVSSDTYIQSFMAMSKIEFIPLNLAKKLVEGAKLRNILVHEYDFVESDEKFYHSAKSLLPAYEEYAKAIYAYIAK